MVTLTQRQPRWAVEVNGVRRTLLGGTTRHSASAFVATATLQLLLSEGKPRPGDTVRVFVGYGASLYVRFTGEIDSNGVTARPNDLEIACSGYLARLKDPIGVAPDIIDGLDGPESDPEPVVTYDSMTAGAIIADVLDRYGVPGYSLEDSGDLFGELEPIPVFGDDPGESLVQDLDQAEIYRTFDGPEGAVHRLPWARVASASAARTFTDDDDLYAGRLEQSRTGIRNRVLAFGLTQKGTTGVEFTPTGLAEEASALVPTPPGFRAATYQLPLLESGDRCQAWAEAKLGELNRLTQTLPVELVAGDPTLNVGMTVAVESATLGLSGGERLLIEEVTEEYSETEGYNTSLTLYLTAEGAGYNPNLPPVAVIAMKGMRQTLADGTDQYEVSLDGSASFDPELGIAGIVSYEWTGSPETPVPVGVGTTANVRYADDIPDGATVTLTVTDDLGAEGHLTLPITTASVSFVVRDIIAAVKTKLETSRDGQRTWVAVQVSGSDIAAVGTCEIGAKEYTFAWTAAGALYKVLADDTATLVTPGGGNITACTIHTDQAGNADGRVWVGCADGSVYRSPDHGVTWEAKAPAPNGQAVTYIQESYFAEGQMEMLAGNVYYTSFSAAGDWVASYTHPNTALTAARFAAGFGQGWIGFRGPNNGLDAGAPRLRERTTAVDIGPASGVLAIVGLTMGIDEAIVYVADNDPDTGTGRLWSAPTDVSGNLTAHTYDDATYDELRHMIRDGGLPGLLYLAAKNALLKSPDGLATVQAMRTLSGGREGMMIGYGAERALASPLLLVSTAGAERVLSLWNGSGNDAPPSSWYGLAFDDSAWGLSVAHSVFAGWTIYPGTQAVWSQAAFRSTEQALFRRTFVVVGTVAHATLRVMVDNQELDIYLNGVRLGGDTADPVPDTTGKVYDVRDVLLPNGATNVLAIRGGDTSGITSWLSYRLEVNT